MRTPHFLALGIALASLPVHAQGPLIPPGPPAPTMKTLEQVEPRTPISSLPFDIRNPGSYYLTAELTGVGERDGISVNASDVTIDLEGFTLRGVPGSRHAILIVEDRENVTVRNGTLHGWGGRGIDGSAASRCRFSDLVVNSCGSGGLRASADSVVERCQVTATGGEGISVGGRGQVRNCLAYRNTAIGIDAGAGSQVLDSVCGGNATGIQAGERCLVSRCNATANLGDGIVTGSGSHVQECAANSNSINGIIAGAGSRVQECAANSNTQVGIDLLDGATVLDCSSTSNSTDGIRAANKCLVRNNTCSGNGLTFFGAGVRVTGDDNRIENNHLTGADRGLWITGTNNRVAGNTVRANPENYVIAAGNHLHLLLGEIPETISWPATVELAGTLTGTAGADGIVVDASGVTIDLKGHSLVGVPGSLDGIRVVNVLPDHRDLTVKNGTIASWGGMGINATNCDTGSVRDVSATGNGGSGIATDITTSTFSVPVGWLVRDCSATANGGDGIACGSNTVISGCTSNSNTLNGFHVDAACIVKKCVATNNEEHGIRAANDNVITGNTCDENTMDGILAHSGDTRVEGNHVTDNDRYGIHCSSGGNLVIRNTAADNTTANYFFVTNNRHGPIVNVQATNGDISGVANSEHPWANFEF